jgi:hypothetical protein
MRPVEMTLILVLRKSKESATSERKCSHHCQCLVPSLSDEAEYP